MSDTTLASVPVRGGVRPTTRTTSLVGCDTHIGSRRTPLYKRSPDVRSPYRCTRGREGGPLVGVEEVMHRPRSDALRALYWRSEILQVMFWLKDEGFGDEVDVTLLERFLGVDCYIRVQYLEHLVDGGYVERVGDRYKLSEAGAREGGLEFAASFEELIRPGTGECSRDSWCHNSPDEDRFRE